MMNVRQLTKVLTFLLLALPVTALAANDIRFTSTAEIEVQQVNIKGEKVVVRQPATLLQPGQIAIYTNSFTNVGQQPASNVVINNPVPANTEYLGGSATETGFDVVFSTDKGKSFGKPTELTVPDGKGGKRPAEPKEYTNIRWTMQALLKPGATGVVEFRVRVK
ncbi:MAG: DUF11 domain-containing protein [Desulfuromonas sp.]|nr:DUF11 domain-containing protein [Desulfuromonas sp.]